MAKRATKPAAKSTNTEGQPSAKAAPTAEPNPSEGAQSSTNVTGDAPEVQTTEAGKVADAGMTALASATATNTEFSGGLPSVAVPNTAEPEPTSVMEGAPSSSAEAVAAAAQATETGEAAGKDEADVLPAADSTSDQVAEAFAAQAGLDEKTIEAIKTQILGLPRIERRKFLAYRTVRHDGVRTVRGGWLALTMAAHASLAARDLVSKDWDNGVRVED
jgi:hypothetical protein